MNVAAFDWARDEWKEDLVDDAGERSVEDIVYSRSPSFLELLGPKHVRTLRSRIGEASGYAFLWGVENGSERGSQKSSSDGLHRKISKSSVSLRHT